jgi:hypothetical protein
MTESGAVRDGAVRSREQQARWLGELAEALGQEAEVARELREALIRQRDAVAACDDAGVEASVEAVGRVLLTLETARRRRGELVASVTGRPDLPLEGLETAVGAPLPAALLHARQRLRRAAQDVTHEVAINRTVLRRAVEAGETFLQALFSAAGGPAARYAPAERPEAAGATGVLVNRRA